MGTLPDELLCDILSYNLTFDLDSFFRAVLTPEDYPSPHRSRLLLVSKRWLRVGTPLLYRFLILTKRKHTVAVACVFRAQPAIAHAVRCLRIDGGLAKDLVDVVGPAAGLHSVFINLHFKFSDRVSWMENMAKAMRPKDLYIIADAVTERAKSHKIWERLSTSIRNDWTSLVSRYSYHPSYAQP